MIRLRQATEADVEFLRDVRRAAMEPHIIRAYGRWDEESARKKEVDPRTQDVIEFDGVAVGNRYVRRHPDALELVRIFLLPEAQGRGIGTEVVRELLAEATGLGLPVRLRVLKENPAKRLYERLGFVTTEETEYHFRMQAAPGTMEGGRTP